MANVYCVRDRKANVYWKPVYERDHVMAIRGFEDTCKNPESSFHKWPGDFELLHLGKFDENTGKFVQLETPAVMADPMQFLSGPKVAQ